MSTDSSHTAFAWRRWLARLDAAGAIASLLCAVHCVLVPLLLVLAPWSGLEWLSGHRYERIFVALALVFAVLVIGTQYSLRTWTQVRMLYVIGAIGLIAGAYVSEGMWWHALAMGVGGTALGLAHGVNRYAIHKRAETASLWRP